MWNHNQMVQQHYDDLGKKILELTHTLSSSNFILNVRCDNASSIQ